MANDDPAFLFYSDNFLSGTMFLSDEQVGKYIRLLCAQHLTGHLEEKHMIFICKSRDEDIWKKFVRDEDGKYYNERLEYEINRRRAYSESRSKNKKGKVKADTAKRKNTSKSYDLHMGNGNGNGNEIEKEDFFNLFWAVYPKHKSKGDAEKAWKTIKPDRALASLMIEKIKQAKASNEWLKEGGRYIPYPASWLRAKGWEDEYKPVNNVVSESSINILTWAERKENELEKE